MTRRRRDLSPEERALWRKVTKDDVPLRAARAGPAKTFRPPPRPKQPPTREPILPFEIGARSETALPGADFAPTLKTQLDGLPLRMDRKAHRRLKAGKTEPEARIDLHGMTAERARSALSGFILASRARGLRTVLVITGKGRADPGLDPIPRPQGLLRHEVPRWLSLPPLAGSVLQVVPAHRRHGGSGAYYVHLARAR